MLDLSTANERGCAKVGFPYIRKPRKDYRLEAKWEENAVKVLKLRTGWHNRATEERSDEGAPC